MNAWHIVEHPDAVVIVGDRFDAGVFDIMDGNAVVATVYDRQQALLIVGVPGLWTAANEVMRAASSLDTPETDEGTLLKRLGDHVARCVGKNRWQEVEQE